MSEPLTTVITLSGGLDSAVLLWQLLGGGDRVLALSVDYGQRHRVELDHAARLAAAAGVRHEVADLRGVGRLLSGSALTDPAVDVPSGHYASDSMKQTIVPNRNMILLSVAAGWALAEGADRVAYAAHAGDHTIYPDCRPVFAEAVAAAIALADWRAVELVRPFIAMSKADLVRRGAALGVPFELTWSCYRGGKRHCGTCGTCVERREAFELAGVGDPTVYAVEPV